MADPSLVAAFGAGVISFASPCVLPLVPGYLSLMSGLSAAVAGILLGGFAGVSAQVDQGLEFSAITAVVLGGVVLGGGRGTVVAAMAGALTLEALFTLLNLYGVSGALEDTVQGIIIIAAVAFASYRLRGAR